MLGLLCFVLSLELCVYLLVCADHQTVNCTHSSNQLWHLLVKALGFLVLDRPEGLKRIMRG
jgi:hypothetical protein